MAMAMTWSWAVCRQRCCCLFVIALWLLLCPNASTQPASRPVHPHIIFVVADDAGWGDVGWGGSGHKSVYTPNLNALALNGGTVFTQYYVQPTCSPSRAALLTGRSSVHTGVFTVCCGPYTMMALPRRVRGCSGDGDVVQLLPEALAAFNYESHAVGKWHLGMHSNWTLPTRRGFDSFFGFYDGSNDHWTHGHDGFRDLHNDTVEYYHDDDQTSTTTTHHHRRVFSDRAVAVSDVASESGVGRNDAFRYSTHMYTRQAQQLSLIHI